MDGLVIEGSFICRMFARQLISFTVTLSMCGEKDRLKQKRRISFNILIAVILLLQPLPLLLFYATYNAKCPQLIRK